MKRTKNQSYPFHSEPFLCRLKVIRKEVVAHRCNCEPHKVWTVEKVCSRVVPFQHLHPVAVDYSLSSERNKYYAWRINNNNNIVAESVLVKSTQVNSDLHDDLSLLPCREQ